MAKKQEIENIGLELKMHFIRKYGTQFAAAEHFGVSPAMISGIVKNKRKPQEHMLEDAGFRYETQYYKV